MVCRGVAPVCLSAGDSDIVASFVYQDPHCLFLPSGPASCVHADFAQHRTGSDNMTIAAASLPATLPAYLYIGVFGFVDSYFSIVARQSNSNNIPSFIQLFDGEPQAGFMQPVVVCATRDPVTRACVSTPYTRNGAFFRFNVPANTPRPDAYMMVNKVCNGVVAYCQPDIAVRRLTRACPLCVLSRAAASALHPMCYRVVRCNSRRCS
jgi:hypothetical protein